jgi:hypothetical protein
VLTAKGTHRVSGADQFMGTCDDCGLVTPDMQGTRESAARILATAGWVVHDDEALCPRCETSKG